VGGNPEADALRHGFVDRSFSEREQVALSPVYYARMIRARVLLAASAGDLLATCERQLAPYEALRAGTTYCLPAGDAPFIHADVTAAALAAQQAREHRLLLAVERHVRARGSGRAVVKRARRINAPGAPACSSRSSTSACAGRQASP
jgi:hypothetical protein